MDLLDDILAQAGLRSRILHQRTIREPLALAFPCDKSIGFHVVVQGSAYLHVKGKKSPLVLQRGDIALMARGKHHVVSTEETLPKNKIYFGESTVRAKQKDDPRLTLVSGAYQLWHEPVHPFFGELPECFVLPADVGRDQVPLLTSLLAAETADPTIGSERITRSLLDLLLALILRRVLERSGAKPKTWCHAVRDRHLQRVLEKMHAESARNWSIEELARTAGLSRAGFALRFKQAMGETPHRYLTVLRLQRAVDLLVTTEKSVEQIALAVGYQDPFTFSKAFKKRLRVSPRQFRQRDREAANGHGRFGTAL